jgi:hypothetical protein
MDVSSNHLNRRSNPITSTKANLVLLLLVVQQLSVDYKSSDVKYIHLAEFP